MSIDLPKCITDTSGIFDIHNRICPISSPILEPARESEVSKPFDIEAYQAEQRPFWELKNVFDGIHTVIQRVLRKYSDNDWKPLSDETYLTSIDESSGSPKVSNPGSIRNIIDVGWFYSLLELYYSYPVDMSITCAQWQKFVGINNSLAKIYVTVQEYSWMRAKMPKPEDFLEVVFREPIPLIGVLKYWSLMKNCLDYDSHDSTRMERLYPYYL